jgi:hypothetical protein
MVSSNIYVTPSTSLILIKSLAQPTNIYLSTLNVPDFQVKIRDGTGSSLLATNPINISTVGGARFTNNSVYYAITQPYGFVNVSLRTSTLWQILHTSGQVPADSAANIQTTNISTSYFGLLSTASKYVSTLTVENLDTPNSITLTGPFIVGNLSTPGFILLQSTLNVRDNTVFSQTADISGSALFRSSLFIESLAPISSALQTYSSFQIGGSLQVGGTVFVTSTLYTQSSLQVLTTSVEKNVSDPTVFVMNSLSVRGMFSTLGTLQIGNSLTIQNSLTVNDTLSSLNGQCSTGALIIGGTLNLLSSLHVQSTAQIFSSFLTQSSLSLQTSFSTLSSMNVAKEVSTTFFYGNYLSSGTSFSTASDFTVLSTLRVTGTLSTHDLTVGALFTSQTLNVSQGVSSYTTLALSDGLYVKKSAVLGSLDVANPTIGQVVEVGVGGNVEVKGTMAAYFLNLDGKLVVGSNVETTNSTGFQQDMGVESDVFVGGNMTVVGIPNLNSFDVTNYELSSLQIITSSPSIALRTSTFTASTLHSDYAKLVYNPLSGSITVPISSLAAEEIYARIFKTYILSTQSLYAESVLSPYSLIPPQSFPQFEIDQKASFPRGLSTPSLFAGTATADLFQGSFIGDAQSLSNIILTYSTLSAAIVTVSTVQTNSLSSKMTYFGNPSISTSATIAEALYFYTPVSILSTGVEVSPPFSTLFRTTNFPTIQPVNQYTLGINETVYLDSLSRKVGVLTSTPQYDLDIRGSLYCSGTFTFSSQNILYLSSINPVVTFSTLYYSSIAIQDTLIIGSNSTAIPTKYLALRANDSNYTNLMDKSTPVFYLSERAIPQTLLTGGGTFHCGIFTDQPHSTLDINYQLFLQNNTRNVGLNTLAYSVSFIANQSIVDVYPLSLNPGYDLSLLGNINAKEALPSSLNTTTKLVTSTLNMPRLGLNTTIVSTFNTISTSFSTFSGSNIITMNACAEFFKDTSLVGSFHVKRPSDSIFVSSLFCVYTDAYFSSITINNLHAQTILYEFQDV